MLAPFFGLGCALELAKPIIPETIQKALQLQQSFGPGTIHALRALAPDRDQPRLFQHFQVLGDGGSGDLKARGDFAGGEFLDLNQVKDLAAMGFGDGVQHNIDHGTILVYTYENVN
jgi:hypothetical protein